MKRLSLTGRIAIKRLEGMRLDAYDDGVGVWTIGYGHTEGVVRGDRLASEAEADELLITDLVYYETAVHEATDGVSSQGQFDAMVLLAFNIGIAAFKRSSVLKAHNRGDYDSAARAFSLWNKAGGRVMSGLVKRRAEEAALYIRSSPTYVHDEDVQSAPDTTGIDKSLSSSRTVGGGITATLGTLTATATTVAQFGGATGDTVKQVKELGIPILWIAIIASVFTLGGICWMIWARFQDKRRGYK